jgi:ferrochelatase
MKKGLLLINLGTPDAPDTSAVRRYLREFLADKRVITLAAPLRYLLLYCFILPFRSSRTAHAYQTIWTPRGSPLRYHSQALVDQLQKHLGSQYKVALGMRYGHPSIKDALLELKPCEKITILPLYPQYSSAATGSSIQHVLEAMSPQTILPSIDVIRDFHNHPAYIDALTASIKPYIPNHDYVLFSYHGVPEAHLHQGGCETICPMNCPSTTINDKGCYKAQCQETTALTAQQLGLNQGNYSMAFQSRLGKLPWIKPYTDEILKELRDKGVKRLAVACPSFVTDCLETLEEIGVRLKEQWLHMGGETLTCIPCLNDNEQWLSAILKITRIDPR